MMPKKNLLDFLIVIRAIGAGIVFSLLLSTTICPIKRIIGLPCPGCGMTRAVFSAIRGNFSDAFASHPLWPVLPVFLAVLGLYSFDSSAGVKQRKWYEGILFAIAFLMIAVWIVRLCLGWRG